MKPGTEVGWASVTVIPVREPIDHRLKIAARWFDRLADGTKTCEVRPDDRDFQIGDTITVGRCPSWREGDYREDLGMCVEAQTITFVITHVLRGGQFGIQPGYSVLSLARSAGAPS